MWSTSKNALQNSCRIHLRWPRCEPLSMTRPSTWWNCGVCVASEIDAIGAARADHADRGLLGQHGAHLHRRGVGAQQHARAVFLRIEKEGVVHLPCRMALGEIQFCKVVVVGLDVGAFGDRKTHIGEDRRQLIHHLAERMDPPRFRRRLAQRQGDVDGLGGKAGVQCRRFQDLAARGERLGDRILGEIDRRALRLALLRRHLAEGREQRRDRALLAERGDANGFQRGFVASGGDISEDGLVRGLRGRTRSISSSKRRPVVAAPGPERQAKSPSEQAGDSARLNPCPRRPTKKN